MPTRASAQEEPHLKRKKKKNQSSWFNPQILLPQLLLQPKFNDKLFVLLIILSSGSRLFNCQRDLQRRGGKTPKQRKQRKKTRDEITDCPTFGTISLPSGRAAGRRQLAAARTLLLSPASCLRKEFKHRGLTHIASSALRHRPGNSTSQWQKNFQETLLQPLITELWLESN